MSGWAQFGEHSTRVYECQKTYTSVKLCDSFSKNAPTLGVSKPATSGVSVQEDDTAEKCIYLIKIEEGKGRKRTRGQSRNSDVIHAECLGKLKNYLPHVNLALAPHAAHVMPTEV